MRLGQQKKWCLVYVELLKIKLKKQKIVAVEVIGISYNLKLDEDTLLGSKFYEKRARKKVLLLGISIKKKELLSLNVFIGNKVKKSMVSDLSDH